MGVDSSSPSYTPRNQAVSGTVPTKVAVAAGARSSHSLEVFSYKRIYFLAVLVLPFFLTSRSTAAALCGVVPAAACTWFKGVFGAFLEDSDPTHTHASAAFNASPSPAVAAVSVSILDVMKHWPLPAMLLAAVSVAAMLYTLFTTGRPHLLFAYNCFIKPFLLAKRVDGVAADDHQKRLEAFYEGQADVYDVTRRRLLRGRNTMLKLAAAQLRQVYNSSTEFDIGINGETVADPSGIPSPLLMPATLGIDETGAQVDQQQQLLLMAAKKRYAWIEIGGGTGENIEKMNKYFPIANFHRVYLIDITPSLCEIARKRFTALGWTNVTVMCMDASTFEIPPQDDPDNLDIALITCSYSLSMMETYYPLIDRLSELLSPQGIIGISDFYVSSKRSQDPTRQLTWFQRWFWAVWFDLDNIYLHPSRREYLEHKFITIKQYNGKNPFVKPLVYIPYYVWLGGKQQAIANDTDAMEPLSLDADQQQSTSNKQEPLLPCLVDTTVDPDLLSDKEDDIIVQPTATTTIADQLNHLVSSTHCHGQGQRWRVPFDINLIPRFSTYIYAFAWEDPKVDLEFLDLTRDDTMLVITSGGCNVLEYASRVGPKRIYSVDLNPCQNNMLELKLASMSSLCYNDYWKLFGEGFLEDFSTILDTNLSPHLSPYAYHFWKKNKAFTNLFKTGCSGLAVRIFQLIQKLRPGLKKSVHRMCHCETLEEQWTIWENEVRPLFLSTWLVRLLNNDRFLWGALGVPKAQMQMILEEGSAYEYVVNTFDPVIRSCLLSKNNYFYYMPLNLKYAVGNCPYYLTEEGFDTLMKDPSRLDAIQIHTNTILNVLESHVADGELTKVILMDHLDWFSEEDARQEISKVFQKLKSGGRAYWRSGGKRPWYNEIFEDVGFAVKPCQIREGETLYIDRVNMYASFYVGIKK